MIHLPPERHWVWQPALAERIALLACIWVAWQPAALQAQLPADSFTLVSTFPIQARFATADHLDNIYVLTPQNALEKYAPDGRLLARYTNNRLGAVTAVDPANPLKILVWYADFRTVVFLDRNLTALGTLDLISAGFPDVRTVSGAADGNLWVYDEANFQLRKITPAGEPLFESQRLNQLYPGRVAVTCIHDNGSEVLAADPQWGILWFDVYGQFQKSLPWTNISTFILSQNQLQYRAGGQLHIEQLQAFASRTRPLPASALPSEIQSWLAPGLLLVQNGDILEVWQ